MRIILRTLVALAVIGCAGSYANPIRIRAPFIESEYAPFREPGSGSISGAVALNGAEGGAGRTVYLDPATTYSAEWFDQMVRGHGVNYMAPVDGRFLSYRRAAVADGSGRFEFRELPAGEYFLTCDLWTDRVVIRTGGFAHARVMLYEGDRLENVVVAR